MLLTRAVAVAAQSPNVGFFTYARECFLDGIAKAVERLVGSFARQAVTDKLADEGYEHG